mgnify:CR=1 FL=1
MRKKVTALILAAGKSKRTKTSKPKVLLELAGRPLIFHIIDNLKSLFFVDEIVVVLGHRKDLVEEAIKREFKGVRFVYQNRLNGTAKAVETARKLVKKDSVLVLCADTPLITRSTLRKFINFFFKSKADCAIITALFKERSDLGRVLRDEKGKIKAIVEKVDIKSISGEEVNSGIYCFNKKALFRNIGKIKANKRKKEFFLTDIIGIFYRQNLKVEGFCVEDATEVLGINTQKNLSLAQKIINRRLINQLMDRGVTIVDPDTTFVSFDTKIGRDTIVYPFTFIEKNVIIGSNCVVGPFAHIRAKSKIEEGAKVGNFTEVNRSILKKNVKMKHFSYVGDTRVGENTNIGAGTIVANYDGKRKHHTIIGREAFIGSGTVIVAPSEIGNNAVTGAGSVVTRPVKSNTVVVGVPAKFLKKRKQK